MPNIFTKFLTRLVRGSSDTPLETEVTAPKATEGIDPSKASIYSIAAITASPPSPETKEEAIASGATEEIDPSKLIKLPGSIEDSPKLMEAQKVVKNLFMEKLIREEKDFSRKEAKTLGVSSGYIANRVEDGATTILKHAYKRNFAELSSQHLIDQRDLLTEYLTSKLYKRAIPKRSPLISLADGERPEEIYLTSKFYKDFQTLTELTGASGNGGIYEDHSSLKKINGFEQIIAGCLFGGELDYHASNLGVVPSRDDKGAIITNPDGTIASYEMVKIDHGRSTKKYKSESHMRKVLAFDIEDFGYQGLKLNTSVLKESIAQMIQISDDEIGTMIARGLDDLHKLGLEIGHITPVNERENFANLGKTKKTTAFATAQEYFVENFVTRRGRLKEFKHNLEIIEKIDSTPDWQDGRWLQDIKDKNPIAWATEYKKTIDGQHPLIWATNQEQKIDGQHPLIWATDLGKRIGNQHPFAWAIKHNKKIDGQHPLALAMERGEKFKAFYLVPWAIRDNLTIEDKNPIVWAMDNGKKIDGQHPLSWLVKFAGKEIDSSLEANLNDDKISNPEKLTLLAVKMGTMLESKDEYEREYASRVNNYLERIRKPKEGYDLGPQSDTYQYLIRHSSSFIAQKLLKEQANTQCRSGEEKKEFNLHAIMEQCPIELAAKIASIGEKLEQQQRAKQKGGIASVKLNISNSLRNFGNICKGLIGKQVTDEKLNRIFSSLDRINNAATRKPGASTDHSQVSHQIKTVLEKGATSYSDLIKAERVRSSKITKAPERSS